MKLDLNILNKIVDLSSLEINDVIKRLTLAGFEVENYYYPVDCDKLVIGEITEIKKDSENDKLNICKVNVKNSVVSILTTAQNVYLNMKVVVALDGTNIRCINKLIKKTKLYNHVSDGMMLGWTELGIEKSYLNKKEIEGLIELDLNAPIGEDAIKYINLNLPILEVSILPNRIDVYNYFNFAKEFVGLFKIKNRKTEFIKIIDFKKNSNNYKISLKTNECSFYSLSVIDNVEIAQSPIWLRLILWCSGISTINNIVDTGNLTTILFNQPVHFFDKDKLISKNFEIKNIENVKINTLNNKQYNLNGELCIVNKNPIAIAGIIGELSTSVNNETKNLILEVANFNLKKIRESQKSLNLYTDSSIRYS